MITAYISERFRAAFFGPVAILLAIAALGGRFEPWAGAIEIAGALFLLAQFRVWDDLADRGNDAVAHPERVLGRAPGPTPILALGLTLLAINFALALQRDPAWVSVTLLALLHAVLGVHYLLRRGRTLLGDQLLLAKYPAFVCVLAGPRLAEAPVAIAVAAAAIYAGASAYEAWHDPVSPLRLLLGVRA